MMSYLWFGANEYAGGREGRKKERRRRQQQTSILRRLHFLPVVKVRACKGRERERGRNCACWMPPHSTVSLSGLFGVMERGERESSSFFFVHAQTLHKKEEEAFGAAAARPTLLLLLQ